MLFFKLKIWLERQNDNSGKRTINKFKMQSFSRAVSMVKYTLTLIPLQISLCWNSISSLKCCYSMDHFVCIQLVIVYVYLFTVFVRIHNICCHSRSIGASIHLHMNTSAMKMLHAFQYNHEILVYGEHFRTNNQHTLKKIP